MKSSLAKLKWGVERRLEFIEFRLQWEDGVNRSDLIETFGVSVPQASKDLTLYQERAPQNAVYDKSAKRYKAGPAFEPIFRPPNSEDYLTRLRALSDGWTEAENSWIGVSPPADVAVTPKRSINSRVLREILSSVRDNASLEIYYQSMSREDAEPSWRRISAHAFGFDGFRWHVRAYCHRDNTFKDFLLPRILETRSPAAPGASAEDDCRWQDFFEVEIAPNPALTESQRNVVEKDFAMHDGKAVLTVRYAMLFYVLKRLGLLADPATQSPRTQHIVTLNRDATDAALIAADAKF